MALTPAQKATLKAYILSDPVLGPKATGAGTDYQLVADALNADANPVTKAWVTSVAIDAADEAPDYSTFDSIQAGKRDSWDFFLRRSRDFSRNKVRKWITDVWGNSTAGSNSEAILLAGTENAKRAEAVIGGTVRTTGTVSALDRAFIGTFSAIDIGPILA